MGHNIELKARVAEFGLARQVANRLENRGHSFEHQIDTYFACSCGRLKLRQRDGLAAQLISYERPDDPDAASSRYHILEVGTGELCRQMLQAALGILCVVDKKRDIYLHDNVRIHLDEVIGLGHFVEFEAVVGPDADESICQSQIRQLRDAFQLAESMLVGESYSDMIIHTLQHNAGETT